MTGVFLQRVDLPSGGWVDLRPAKTVPERLRRPAKATLMEIGADPATAGALTADTIAGIDPHTLAKFDTLNDLLAVAFVAAWSLEGIPVSVEALQDLPGEDYDAVQNAVAPLWRDLFPDFTPNKDTAGDPKAPTGS